MSSAKSQSAGTIKLNHPLPLLLLSSSSRRRLGEIKTDDCSGRIMIFSPGIVLRLNVLLLLLLYFQFRITDEDEVSSQVPKVINRSASRRITFNNNKRATIKTYLMPNPIKVSHIKSLSSLLSFGELFGDSTIEEIVPEFVPPCHLSVSLPFNPVTWLPSSSFIRLIQHGKRTDSPFLRPKAAAHSCCSTTLCEMRIILWGHRIHTGGCCSSCQSVI